MSSGLERKAGATAVIDEVATRLRERADGELWRPGAAPMPSVVVLREIMDRLRAAFFPGYFGRPVLSAESLGYHMAANLDSVRAMLSEQIVSGLCLACGAGGVPCDSCRRTGEEAALDFMRALPGIRELLAGDARAAYEGDPAATSVGETIFSYPSIAAMFHHRVAHALYSLKIPIIPRIIAEMAHSATGIDIHPGASIGENFFIDHGTGVVIGETCVIGQGCRLYQGVTLGALSFPKNSDGTLTKGIPRHPILEDNVTVYAGATILGRITIGKGAVIGGNVWITEDVPPGGRISLHESA
ncbi:MAG: serine acetyltransferase [Desulfovibrio sp.]|nr:serine acetyltransferase [Desulfovibrio sp.]